MFSAYRGQPTSFSNVDLSDLRQNLPRIHSLDSLADPLRRTAVEHQRVAVPLQSVNSISDIPSMPRHFLPSKKDVSYDGLTGSWSFVDELEDHFDLYNIPDYYKIQIWGLCLQGVAKTWYRRWRANPLNANSGFEAFKCHFLEVFPLGLNKQQLAAQLFSRHHRPSENCVVFALETVKLYYLWRPEATEAEVLATLIGQLDPYLQDFLELRTPTTVQQCLTFLRKYQERHGTNTSDLRSSSWPVMFLQQALLEKSGEGWAVSTTLSSSATGESSASTTS